MLEQNQSNNERVQDYQDSLRAILSRPLIPEFIDNYAEDALNDLIALVQDTTQTYQGRASQTHDNARTLEEAAFSYYNLGNIEEILDHIANKVDEIRQLDDVIARAKIIDRVVVPPDTSDLPISNGGDSQFEHAQTIPKLKTLLFILSNDFEVNVHDPEQLSLTSGMVGKAMMRRTSYTIVESAKIARTIFICDEANNITYVFDNNTLKQSGITTEDLLSLTKTDLNELLTENPSLGERVRYSKNFVGNLVNALKSPSQDGIDSDETEEAGKYLYPKAPEGYIPSGKLAEHILHIGRDTLRRVAKELEEPLGPINKYRFTTSVGFGYSPKQQAIILQHLEAAGVINNLLPEGYLTVNAVAKLFGTDYQVVGRAVVALADSLGEVKRFKVGSHLALAFSPEQQRNIREYLNSTGLFLEKPPEGFLSIKGIAAATDITHESVAGVVEMLGDILGDTKTYRSGGGVTLFYSPEQQIMILEQLEARGLLNGQAPEGYKNVVGIARLFMVNHNAVTSAIEKLGDELGKANKYRFGSRVTTAYSPAQQEMIRAYLETRGIFADKAPEGYHSCRSLAEASGFSQRRIKKAIESLSEEIGETPVYRFRNQIAVGYSPEQQEMMKQYLLSRQKLK